MKRRSCLHWNYGYPDKSQKGCRLGRKCSDSCAKYQRKAKHMHYRSLLEPKVISPSRMALYKNCRFKELFMDGGVIRRYCSHSHARLDKLHRCSPTCKYKEKPNEEAL